MEGLPAVAAQAIRLAPAGLGAVGNHQLPGDAGPYELQRGVEPLTLAAYEHGHRVRLPRRLPRGPHEETGHPLWQRDCDEDERDDRLADHSPRTMTPASTS